MEGRIYAVIPISKVPDYIPVDYSFGRFSLDKKYLVWDQDWDVRVLEKMRQDPQVQVLTYDEALKMMGTEAWSKAELDNKMEKRLS